MHSRAQPQSIIFFTNFQGKRITAQTFIAIYSQQKTTRIGQSSHL